MSLIEADQSDPLNMRVRSRNRQLSAALARARVLQGTRIFFCNALRLDDDLERVRARGLSERLVGSQDMIELEMVGD